MALVTRDEALAKWDTVFSTRPKWLDALTIEGIEWHLAQAARAADLTTDENLEVRMNRED